MNPEHQESTTSGHEGQAMAIAGDPSLTLSAKKLAGSAECLNCGTDLRGPFCYFCGQPDRNFMRFFPALLRDMLEDLLDLDSRFMRTLKPLLFKPGRLTRDYMSGRRFRYVPPMRLYIFSSIVFFLLAAFLSSGALSIAGIENDVGIIQVSTDSTDKELENLEETLNNLPPEAKDRIDVDQIMTESKGEHSDEPIFDTNEISFNDKPWDRETNPVDIQWLPDWINDRINDEIEGSPQKAEQINENPNLAVDKVFDILPAAMFVLLPVVALIFKFWYLFAKRYYVEHLIYALHNHSFLFVSMTLMLLADLAKELLSSYGYSMAASGAQWLIVAIGIWLPVYMLISLRVVFQQGWLLTVGKFTVIGISYITLLTLVTSGVAIASFILL